MAFPSGCTPIRRLRIQAISIARVRDIELETYRQVIENGNWNFTILPSTAWIQLPLKPQASYQLSSNDTSHGTLYVHECRGDLTPNTAETTDTMVGYKEEDLLVRLTDEQGLEHIMGTVREPARLNFQQLLGTTSGFSFELSSRGKNPLYGYAPVV